MVAVKPVAVGVIEPSSGVRAALSVAEVDAESSEVEDTAREPVSEPVLLEVIVAVTSVLAATPVTVMSAPLITTDPALAVALQVKLES
jgi:hypothetical protein